MSNDATPQRRTARRVVSSVAMDVRPFKIRDFRRLFYGNALTMIGAQMTIVAVGVQVFGQFSGINVINYFGPAMYKALGLSDGQSLLVQGIYGAVGPITNFLCVPVPCAVSWDS